MGEVMPLQIHDGKLLWNLPADMSVREKIHALEAQLAKLPQAEQKLSHTFAKGLYARELFIPKGTLLIGKIHRHECMNILVKGDISVLTEYESRRLVGPLTFPGAAGLKRVGYAHEDTIWINVHATHETDLEKLEVELIAPTYESIELVGQATRTGELTCLGQQ